MHENAQSAQRFLTSRAKELYSLVGVAIWYIFVLIIIEAARWFRPDLH